jgi:hypothetical protein
MSSKIISFDTLQTGAYQASLYWKETLKNHAGQKEEFNRIKMEFTIHPFEISKEKLDTFCAKVEKAISKILAKQSDSYEIMANPLECSPLLQKAYAKMKMETHPDLTWCFKKNIKMTIYLDKGSSKGQIEISEMPIDYAKKRA